MRALLTPRWIARHVLAIALIAACLLLGWWQLSRATAGNTLSWAYTVQWPLFAGFVVFMWARAVRDTRRPEGSQRQPAREPLRPREPMRVPSRAATVPAGDDDPQLAAYNDYLAWLAANPDRRPSDYPG